MTEWILSQFRSLLASFGFGILPRDGQPKTEASQRETPSSTHSSKTKKEVILETLSDSPRVFFVENFFTDEEAEQIIRNVFDEEHGVNELARSTVGHRPGGGGGGGGGGQQRKPKHSNVRTSENAFDSHSEVAIRIKQRAFRLLRIPTWDPSMSDGLQVLRYQLGQAYIPHNDYFSLTTSRDHNW